MQACVSWRSRSHDFDEDGCSSAHVVLTDDDDYVFAYDSLLHCKLFVYIGVYLHDVLGADHFNICSNHFVRFVWAMFSASVTPAYYLLRPGDCDCTWFGLFCVLHQIVN